MNKRKLFIIAVPILAVVGIGIAGAGYKYHRGHHNPEHMVEHVAEVLDLNAEQKQKLEAVKEALQQSRADMRREKQETMDQLIAEVRKPEMDQTEIMTLIEKRMTRIDEMAPAMVKPIIDFHKSLNDQQRGKIVSLLESFRDWGHGHRWRS